VLLRNERRGAEVVEQGAEESGRIETCGCSRPVKKVETGAVTAAGPRTCQLSRHAHAVDRASSTESKIFGNQIFATRRVLGVAYPGRRGVIVRPARARHARVRRFVAQYVDVKTAGDS